MKNFKILIICCLIITLINSCGTIKEGFSMQKKDNTDEFLVEKKNPLKLPQTLMNCLFLLKIHQMKLKTKMN